MDKFRNPFKNVVPDNNQSQNPSPTPAPEIKEQYFNQLVVSLRDYLVRAVKDAWKTQFLLSLLFTIVIETIVVLLFLNLYLNMISKDN